MLKLGWYFIEKSLYRDFSEMMLDCLLTQLFLSSNFTDLTSCLGVPSTLGIDYLFNKANLNAKLEVIECLFCSFNDDS
jgi:hypothetical protein